MHLEFGLESEVVESNKVPFAWGCRAIYKPWTSDYHVSKISLPWDRQSFSGDEELQKEKYKDFFDAINDYVLDPKKSLIFRQQSRRKGMFRFGENEMYRCEYDDRDSYGYLYIVCYPVKRVA